MSPRRWLPFFALLALSAACSVGGSDTEADQPQQVWIGVVAIAGSSNNLEFESEVQRIRQMTGEPIFGREIVVSPVGCFGGLSDEMESSQSDYIIAVRSDGPDRVQALLAELGAESEILAASDLCLD